MKKRWLAYRLKELRTAKHYTQNYVSTQIHLTRSSYSNYERGARTPSLESLVALADLYRISFCELIGIAGCPNSPHALSKEERYLLSVYRMMPHEKQSDMVFFAKLLKQIFCNSDF